jgi:hypothetical protein
MDQPASPTALTQLLIDRQLGMVASWLDRAVRRPKCVKHWRVAADWGTVFLAVDDRCVYRF